MHQINLILMVAFQIAIILIKIWLCTSTFSTHSRMDIFLIVSTLYSRLSWKTTCTVFQQDANTIEFPFASLTASHVQLLTSGGRRGWKFSPHFLFFFFARMNLHFNKMLSLHQIGETGSSSAQKPKYSSRPIWDSVVSTFICTAASAGKTKKIPLRD